MDLSPGEETIIGLLRGEVGVDFTMNVAWLGPKWTVSITSEGDDLIAGSGDTFREALQVAFKVEAGPDDGEAALKPALRLVAASAPGTLA